MSYLTSSSSPQATSRRNRYDAPPEPQTRNATNSTYDHYGEEYEIYETSQHSTNLQPTGLRQQWV